MTVFTKVISLKGSLGTRLYLHPIFLSIFSIQSFPKVSQFRRMPSLKSFGNSLNNLFVILDIKYHFICDKWKVCQMLKFQNIMSKIAVSFYLWRTKPVLKLSQFPNIVHTTVWNLPFAPFIVSQVFEYNECYFNSG